MENVASPGKVLEVVMMRHDALRPYDRNPRRPAGAVAKVKASLLEYGWRQPLVAAPDLVIVVGHRRWEAAGELGWEWVPVHIARDLTPAQIQAYRLMDNRSHDEAEWDKDLLQLELGDLNGAGFDLNLTGFDPAELVGAEPGEAAPLKEVSPVGRFWISVQGPFALQPAAIAAIRSLAGIEGVEVASNVIDA